jgi:hypothetical protein
MKKLHVHRIERHDVNRSAGYLPVPIAAPKYWPEDRIKIMTPVLKEGVVIGYTHTIADDIKWVESQGNRWMGRMDILLTNEEVECTCLECGNSHTCWKQYAVYPGPNGTLTGDVSKFSEEDLEWARQESAKCWAEPMLRKYCA